MFRKVLNFGRTIKGKSKPPGYWDYVQVDYDNPNRPVDDYYIIHKSEAVASSFEVAIILYSMIGFAIYTITRTRYDRDWDRFYHVNYPGLMEHFDRLFDHYSAKTEKTLDNLPSGVSEIYESIPSLKSPTSLSLPSSQPTFDAKMGAAMSSTLSLPQESQIDTKKKLAESDLD